MSADLLIGAPDLFKEYLQSSPGLFESGASKSIKMHELMPYNKTGILPELELQIRRLHEKYHPNIIMPGSKIVVSNGATHMLMALLALAADTYSSVYVPKPYWFRIPDMAKMQHANITDQIQTESQVQLITYPNNPDGKILGNFGSWPNVWYDAVYHWPWYFKNQSDWEKNPLPPIPEIAIFSLSKCTGHCGSRIGWAVINSDHHLANYLNSYVEYDTSGVSVEAQARAATVLEVFMEKDIGSEYKKLLDARKDELSGVLKKFADISGIEFNKENFSIDNGMFGWINDKHNSFLHSEINFMDGRKCGAGEKGFLRINLCASSENWNEAMFRLNMYLFNLCETI